MTLFTEEWAFDHQNKMGKRLESRVARPMPTVTDRPLEGAGKPKRSKYGNVPTVVDGIRFDSKREAGHYQQLKRRQQAGEICDLCANKSELRWKLVIGGVHVAVYEADFSYVNCETGRVVVADSKGCRTREYVMKKKMMQAIYDIDVVEM